MNSFELKKEQVEKRLAQEQHKLERLENRKKYLEKGERTKRTHRLCNLGGTVESLAPEVKDLTRTEMTELMEHIFSLSEVQRAVRHMAITHTNQSEQRKEVESRCFLSSKRHADYRAKRRNDPLLLLPPTDKPGKRLYSEYYGEYSDYTRKGGVICSDILLPSHAPPPNTQTARPYGTPWKRSRA